MDVEEALAYVEAQDGPQDTYPVYVDAALALAAEVRACHATVKRMVVEREELDAELAKWRGKQ